jgi:CRP-like cAMP-binding protein
MANELRKIMDILATFAPLTPEERNIMHNRLSTHTFQAGATIYRAGDHSHSAYIVLDGSVRILAANEHAPIEVARTGMIFGYASVLTNAPRATTAVAEKRTRVIQVPAVEVDMLVERLAAAGKRALADDSGQLAADA